jgi:UDP-N-acetylmuramyl pentapeptide phosphotransferase/UDP-N-acetylglucosamine-1-phosphate transferase
MFFALVRIGLGAAAISAAASILIVLSQRWHGKHTCDHDLDGVQKFHTTAVPRIGGLAIVSSILLTLLLFTQLSPGFANTHVETAMLLLLAGAPAFIAGIVEDLTKGVSVRIRLAASIISALLASLLVHATIDQLDIWGVDTLLKFFPLALIVTSIVVAGGVNAINIIDGFNGLASSAVFVMLAAFGILGWHVGDQLVTEFAVLGLGATLGFFAINYPTGRLFLGDGGAYFLGFWVAEVGVLLLVRNPSVNAWQVLSICAYPVIEVLFTIYRRKILRQASPSSADGLHLHTLVYRRVLPRFISPDAARPWKRNAAVACAIVPCIASGALLSVFAGTTIQGCIAIVAGQLLLYVLIYSRIVRRRWTLRAMRPVETPPVLASEREIKDVAVALQARWLNRADAKSAGEQVEWSEKANSSAVVRTG